MLESDDTVKDYSLMIGVIIVCPGICPNLFSLICHNFLSFFN